MVSRMAADPADLAAVEAIVRAAGTSFYRGMAVLPPSGFRREDREMHGQRRLSGAAFAGEEGDGAHPTRNLAIKIVQ